MNCLHLSLSFAFFLETPPIWILGVLLEPAALRRSLPERP